MSRARIAGLAIPLLGALFAGNTIATEQLDTVFARDVLIIEASAFACHRFDIYIATDPGQRARGLMFVRELPATTGMLFVYEDSDYLSMWMKNTYIPLDMLFVRSDGRISFIARDTEPLSLRSIRSTEPVMYVLELNAGTTKTLNIDTNSRLLWGPTFAVLE